MLIQPPCQPTAPWQTVTPHNLARPTQVGCLPQGASFHSISFEWADPECRGSPINGYQLIIDGEVVATVDGATRQYEHTVPAHRQGCRHHPPETLDVKFAVLCDAGRSPDSNSCKMMPGSDRNCELDLVTALAALTPDPRVPCPLLSGSGTSYSRITLDWEPGALSATQLLDPATPPLELSLHW